uniref:Myb_DNA-bind_7 domain-containing protein n=1 Tax=Meloidogyne hapla TaxID=6305 RepID=A0A1I8BNJ9_MELHA
MLRRRKIQVKPNQGLSKPRNEEDEDKTNKRSKGEELKELNSAEEISTTNNNLNSTELNVQESQLNNQTNSEETNVNNNGHNIISTTSSLESIIVTSSDYSHGLNTFVSVNSNISILHLPENFDRNVPESVVNENRIHLPPLLSSSKTSQQQINNYNNNYCNLPGNVGSPKIDKSDSTISEKRSKERPKEKLCDTKTFTMADLIKWRPRTENTFRKKWSTKRKNDEEEKATLSKTDESDLSTNNSLTPKKGFIDEEDEKPPSGPRVRINEQGEMVVDEDSLIVMQNPENTQLETVINDDVGPKKLTSMSFRKRSRGSIWGVVETDLFYEVLAATGTDFGLMHEFIPKRSRLELKQKFNREHRINPRRMDETLRHPVLLDGRLRQRVERFHAELAK